MNNISFALRGPNSQACRKYSCPFTPNATTGSENSASSLAMMMSIGHAIISPPAIALPCTCAIVGFAMSPTAGVASTLSHIWLIAGIAAAINLASALFPSGLSFAARLPTSFN